MPISHPRLAARGRVGAIAGAAGAIALLMTGCVGASEPTPTPTPTDVTIAPIFATDEEALAAAVSAYEAYSSVVNAIASDGNIGVDRIRGVATDGYARQIETMFEDLAQRGLTIQGTTRVDSFRLVEAATVGGGAEVTILLCSDVSRSRILDASGRDVTPKDRPDRSALQAIVVSSEKEPDRLIVDREDPWSGDYC